MSTRLGYDKQYVWEFVDLCGRGEVDGDGKPYSCPEMQVDFANTMTGCGICRQCRRGFAVQLLLERAPELNEQDTCRLRMTAVFGLFMRYLAPSGLERARNRRLRAILCIDTSCAFSRKLLSCSVLDLSPAPCWISLQPVLISPGPLLSQDSAFCIQQPPMTYCMVPSCRFLSRHLPPTSSLRGKVRNAQQKGLFIVSTPAH